MPDSLPTFEATRYVVPLREGGSLPAVVDTDAGGLFVTKFRGAGQGARVLVAELIAGALAEHLGLRMPELALIDLDASFGRTERDPEIQDILKASTGLNVGLRYLDGAFAYDAVATAELIDADEAADIVWFDAFITNIDRTPRNPNLLVWEREVWLIDHGAALYFHHNWPGVDAERARAPFAPIKDHILLPVAGDLWAAHERLAPKLDEAVFESILAHVPDALLMDVPPGHTPAFETADAHREAYATYFAERLRAADRFVATAVEAQAALASAAATTLSYRR